MVEPGRALVRGSVAADRSIVDGLFTGGAVVVAGTGELLRRLQNGYVRSYALGILGGAVLLVLTLVVVN